MTDSELDKLSIALTALQQTMTELVRSNHAQADGMRAAIMAIAYAIAKQSSIDAAKLYGDASFHINASFEQDEPVPASATEFLAQLHDVISR